MTLPAGRAPRIVSRDGSSPSIRRVGLHRRPLADLYHALVTRSWAILVALAAVAYVAINSLFAGLYLLGDGAVANLRPGNFMDAFSFSVQTLATIGYGVMSPQTLYGHVLVALEALVGVMAFAVMTGLVFAKFSRPVAHVMFSNVAVVASQDGVTSLLFRMANARVHSRIVEAQVTLTLTREEVTKEGVFMRRFYDLKLARDTTPIFALSWTAIHPIDAASPLYGETQETLRAKNAEIVASFVGLDESLSQTLHGRHSYVADELVFGARLADVIRADEHGTRVFDYTRFHDVVRSGQS